MPIELHDAADDVVRVVLSGRIDFASAQAIDAPLAEAARSRHLMVIDLSAVEFIASLGLRSLIKCAKAINSRRGRVVLLSPRPAVAEIIKISGIEELIPIYHSEAEAFAAVGPA
jgi:anti-anti-sigma factor